MSWLPTDDDLHAADVGERLELRHGGDQHIDGDRPDLYPAAVVDSAAPAIVPPVATMTIRGLAVCADAIALQSRSTAALVTARRRGERSEHLCLQS